jgi:iron complex outermembrane receptor protein
VCTPTASPKREAGKKLGLIAAASLAFPVMAATPPADAGELIVTAQLRDQPRIDVPISLNVVSGDDIARYRLDTLEDAASLVPGLQVQAQSPNDPGFGIRGITSDSGTSFDEARVSILENAVSISRSRGSYIEPFDIARIEVARGPQSTLYGRAALIGAVNIVDNKADPTGFAARMLVDRGNYDALTVDTMVNLPLGEDSALRVAGRYRVRDGDVRNLLGSDDFDSVDTRALRTSLHVAAGAATIDLIGSYEHDQPSGTSFKSIAYRPTDPVTGAVTGDTARTSGAGLASVPGFEGDQSLGLKRTIRGLTALASYRLSETMTLYSSTSYRRFDAREVFDADGLSLPILTAAEDAAGRQASQELRLTYQTDALTAFAGANYLRESASQRTPAMFDERMLLARLAGVLNGAIAGRPATDPAPAALFADSRFTAALLQAVAASAGDMLSPAEALAIAANLKPQHLETTTNGSRTRSIDLFGDVAYRVGGGIELGAGVRYSRDDKRSSYSSAVLNGRSILGGFIAGLTQPPAVRDALLAALAVPGAAGIPPSAAYPVPLFGLSLQPTAGNGASQDASLHDGGFAWRTTARYEVAPETSLYMTYARGRRPAVLASSAPAIPLGDAGFDRLPSERVDSYEIGAKTASGRKLLLEAALYRYDYSNFQSTALEGTQLVPVNRGRARSYGAEGDVRWTPSDTFTLFANYAFNHSRFADGARKGNHLRLAPDQSAALGMTLTATRAQMRLSFSPTITYQSRVFFDDDNDRPDLQQPPIRLIPDNIQDETQSGYALANAVIGLRPAGDRWRIEGFVRNLFNRKYVIDAGNTGDEIGLPTFIAGRPRFYGIGITLNFGAH